MRGHAVFDSSAAEVPPDRLALLACQIFKPGTRSRIVMCSGVRHGIRHKVFGKIRIIGMAVECELQDPHAREMKLIPQDIYIGRNHSQIFGNEWQTAQFLPYSAEKFATRTRNPDSGLRSRC